MTTSNSAASQAVPAPDDLAGWKEADRHVAERFADHLRRDARLRSSRAAKRYFGDENLTRFLQAHRLQSVGVAYTAWGILDYRPTRKSRTRAEEMLAKGLPEAEARLLRARIEAHPTLYRVAGHDPQAGTVALEDVLLGGTVTVHDRLMSESIWSGLRWPRIRLGGGPGWGVGPGRASPWLTPVSGVWPRRQHHP